MTTRISPLEHPATAIALHWAHVASFAVLAYSGFRIHALPVAARMASTAGDLHKPAMLVFMLSAVARLGYAFIGSGTAARGSFDLIPDWKHFLPQRGDAKLSLAWLAHYAGLKRTVPDPLKYNPLQRFVYTTLVPAGIIMMTLTGLALWPSTCEIFMWVTDSLGGEPAVRAVHYYTMWAMIGLTALHVYAAIADGLGRIALMMFGLVPAHLRAEHGPARTD